MTTQTAKMEKSFDMGNVVQQIQHVADQLFGAVCVDAVYGTPVERADTLVVPSAEVFGMMGFGLGFGRGQPQADVSEGVGGGGGGWGRVFSRPVALIVLGPQGARVEPVVDVTKLGLAAITAFGFMAGMLLSMSNRRRALKALRSP